MVYDMKKIFWKLQNLWARKLHLKWGWEWRRDQVCEVFVYSLRFSEIEVTSRLVEVYPNGKMVVKLRTSLLGCYESPQKEFIRLSKYIRLEYKSWGKDPLHQGREYLWLYGALERPEKITESPFSWFLSLMVLKQLDREYLWIYAHRRFGGFLLNQEDVWFSFGAVLYQFSSNQGIMEFNWKDNVLRQHKYQYSKFWV